jgi:hypothetical protein
MIKWIAIFLLLVNVGYFGWQMNQRLNQVVPATAVQKTDIPASVDSLVLLSELDELPPLRDEHVITEIEETEPASTNEVVPGETLPFSSDGACFSIGPFSSEDQLLTLSRWLQTRNMPSKERVEEKRTRERYWVYLEPQDEAEAKAQLEELKNKGVSDYYMISKGEKKNTISLGLFSSQDAVNRRLVELERKGYNPVVVPQHKISKVFWLDVQLEDGLTLPELPEEIEITNLDCLEIALLGPDQ